MSFKSQVTFALLSLFTLSFVNAEAHFEVGTTSNFSTGPSQPLWMHANQDGFAPADPYSTTTWFDSYYSHLLPRNVEILGGLSVGASVTDQDISAQLREAWLSAEWRGLELKGGLFPFRRGFVPMADLSSGSISVSGNAYPLPSIQLSTPDFISVPGTDQNVAVLGGVSQGWFTGDGTVVDHLLHEKWAYLRLGDPATPLSIHGGLIHQVLWAGRSDLLADSEQPAPATFDNFIRVVTSKSGGSDSPVSDQLNRLGDTKGIWDLGVSLRLEHVTVHGYYHHFFEDGSGFRWLNAFDGLTGMALELHHNLPILPRGFVRERLDSRYQSGELHDVTVDGTNYILGGRDSYYHNGTYVNGWSHRDRIIGNPLFVLSGAGTDARIASNRIWARHTAAHGVFTDRISYRVLVTHAWHYPAYSSVSIVSEEQERVQQWHNLVELEYQAPFRVDSLRLVATVGFDVGSVYDDSVGFGLSAVYSF